MNSTKPSVEQPNEPVSELSQKKTGETEMTLENKQNISFFKNLLDRRVPHVMGFYLASSWGIIQFVEWIVKRYLLSPHLVELAVVILAALIPSALIIAYFHGKPGRDRWQKFEKIAVPLNFVLTALLVIVLFGDKSMGRVSRKITVQDETGKKIEREVPKSSFRKKIALFYFDNQSGDKTLDWLQYGILNMLELDLDQDLFIDTKSPNEVRIQNTDYYYWNKIKEAGHSEGLGIPLLLKKKIAQETYMGYFLTGTLNKDDNGFVLETMLYRTKNAKLVAKQSIRSNNIFKCVDLLSLKLKQDLNIPESHIEGSEDLPVAEMFTNSFKAARLHTLGVKEMIITRNWKKARQFIEESIKEDPTFAIAYQGLLNISVLNNLGEESKKIYQTIAKYNYKLTERTRFYNKMGFYFAENKVDKGIAVLKMIIELYPEDAKAYAILAVFNGMMNKPDESIATYKKLLKIDPHRYDVYQLIGAQYQAKKNYKEALNYYEMYGRHFPKDLKLFTSIGSVHESAGNFKEARVYYEKALLLNPESVQVLTTMALIDARLGKYDDAMKQLQAVLKLSKKPKEKVRVYDALAKHYSTRGQMELSAEMIKLQLIELEKYLLPIQVTIYRTLMLPSKLAQCGNEPAAFALLESQKPKLKAPFDNIIDIAYIEVYMHLKKTDIVEARFQEYETKRKANTEKDSIVFINRVNGFLHEMKGEYREAITAMEEVLKVHSSNRSALLRMSRCYRELNQFEEAEKYLNEILKTEPYQPNANYELSMLYLGKGDNEKALTHLKKALEIWKDADPNYKPALLAKKKLAEF